MAETRADAQPKRGIKWANVNQIREFTKDTETTVNSTRPSQPGPPIELPERVFNPIRNMGLTSRPLGVKQSQPFVPRMPPNNTRRNTNANWIQYKRTPKNRLTNYRPPANSEYGAVIQAVRNKSEARKSQLEFNDPTRPKSIPSTAEPWYKEPGPAVVGASPASLWTSGETQPLRRLPSVRNTADGGKRNKRNRRSTKRSTRRNTKRNKGRTFKK